MIATASFSGRGRIKIVTIRAGIWVGSRVRVRSRCDVGGEAGKGSVAAADEGFEVFT